MVITTILTGKRPELLRETLESTLHYVPEIRDGMIVALVNGGDKPSCDVLKEFEVAYFKTKELLPIGEAVSLLAEKALKSKATKWLHLEDDWKATKSGLLKALWILDTYPNIAQVKMRSITDPVLKKHMITGEPLLWQRKAGFLYGVSHITFNPSVIRTKDIPKIFPCTGERDAQKNAMKNGLNITAQLDPGIWTHVGDENSLRLQTGCEV